MIIDARRTGRTTALLKAAREIGAAFIVPTEEMARYLRDQPANANMKIYALDDLPVGAYIRCAVYDHTVYEMMARKIENLEDRFSNPNPYYKKVRELLEPLILELDI